MCQLGIIVGQEVFDFWVSEKSRHQKLTFSNDSVFKSFKLIMSFTDNVECDNIDIE